MRQSNFFGITVYHIHMYGHSHKKKLNEPATLEIIPAFVHTKPDADDLGYLRGFLSLAFFSCSVRGSILFGVLYMYANALMD
jgi:hypothetical protein